MPQLETHSKEQGEILTILEGDNCSFCDGTLVQGRYKGNDAVVCSECDTPTVQIW
ncbi:HVO_A0556 family zinc finger protein [Halomontanus rarus]|uniref:HVO_A0556 family zinc finger protein n=1 Tax=Halomontanus rarus TaxID=3034020 RepID=UPI0023E8CDC8|nr:HVO_A0556 family zinc finger protein [Halovivax sp. TS33]